MTQSPCLTQLGDTFCEGIHTIHAGRAKGMSSLLIVSGSGNPVCTHVPPPTKLPHGSCAHYYVWHHEQKRTAPSFITFTPRTPRTPTACTRGVAQWRKSRPGGRCRCRYQRWIGEFCGGGLVLVLVLVLVLGLGYRQGTDRCSPLFMAPLIPWRRCRRSAAAPDTVEALNQRILEQRLQRRKRSLVLSPVVLQSIPCATVISPYHAPLPSAHTMRHRR